MTNYRADLCDRLATYKRDVLGVSQDGLWARNGRAYPHILPAGAADLNILPSIREACLRHPKVRRVKRHRDFHHLNSSQAFAINLFFPLLASDAAHPALLGALGLPHGTLTDWDFEQVIDRREATNFDLLLHIEPRRRAFVEIKLTESEFGSVAKSDVQIRRRIEIYLDRLVDKVDPSILEEDRFFANYQLLRNASYATQDGDRVVFLVPKANGTIAEAAQHFVTEVVRPEYRSTISLVFLEDFVRRLATATLPASVAFALHELAAKYQLPAGSV